MSDRDAFERVLASLYDAMLDDTHWPTTSALIDKVCGLTGNALFVAGGPQDDKQIGFVGLYYRGQRYTEWERQYVEVYHTIDTGVPRLRQQPEGRLVPFKDLYTAKERKTSAFFNEGLKLACYRDGMNVRLDGLDGSQVTWSLADPVGSESWESSQITMLTRLLPHIRQFVRVRQALVRTQALETTLATLLETRQVGVVHLDRRGRILAANDLALRILRQDDGLSDRDGVLRAHNPDDQRRLAGLVAAALPMSGTVSISGSMPLSRSTGLAPLVVQVIPAKVPQPDYGAWHVAVLVLLVEPGRPLRIDPTVVAAALGLTPGESQVAVGLAEGKSVTEMAQATGRTSDAIYWHLRQIYQKLHLSRQVDLVRVVLSLA